MNKSETIRYDEVMPKNRDLKNFQSIFDLADIKVSEWIAIPNKYWPESPLYYNNASHWYMSLTLAWLK